MDNKEAIIQETIKLIEEKGERLDEITVREICKRASVGLGLVNYHFGNKEKLIEQCIERMINGTVEHFQSIREKTDGFTPFEKLEYLGNMTLDFLFEHSITVTDSTSICRIVQCCKRIKETCCKTSKTTISKRWFRFNFFDVSDGFSILF